MSPKFNFHEAIEPSGSLLWDPSNDTCSSPGLAGFSFRIAVGGWLVTNVWSVVSHFVP